MAIIAINGCLGSGKDTVAAMIQKLTAPKITQNGGTNWEIKKFAEKLKQTLSMLTGIPRDKFEDQDFKKNWAINMLTFEVKHVSEVGDFYDENRKNEIISIVENTYKKEESYNVFITIRVLLQLYGTETIRKWFPLAWCNALYVDYKPIEKWRYIENGDKCAIRKREYFKENPDWIVSDLRFPNEFDISEFYNAYKIRIIRGKTIFNDPAKHCSETALDDYYLAGKFDYVIDNTASDTCDGSLEALEGKVKDMLVHFGLLAA